jgi:hypothetical protein
MTFTPQSPPLYGNKNAAGNPAAFSIPSTRRSGNLVAWQEPLFHRPYACFCA